MKCILCLYQANYFYTHNNREFYFCSNCFSVFLSPKNFISKDLKKEIYITKSLNATTKTAATKTKSLCNIITNNFNKDSIGLDFGSGKTSTIKNLLEKEGYEINLFDTYFYPDKSVLKYDFIICNDVLSNFNNPSKEFKQLFEMLNPNGKLYCLVELFKAERNFNDWEYKNDLTKVFFYYPNTIEWISENLGFKNYSIIDDLVIFEK